MRITFKDGSILIQEIHNPTFNIIQHLTGTTKPTSKALSILINLKYLKLPITYILKIPNTN